MKKSFAWTVVTMVAIGVVALAPRPAETTGPVQSIQTTGRIDFGPVLERLDSLERRLRVQIKTSGDFTDKKIEDASHELQRRMERMEKSLERMEKRMERLERRMEDGFRQGVGH